MPVPMPLGVSTHCPPPSRSLTPFPFIEESVRRDPKNSSFSAWRARSTPVPDGAGFEAGSVGGEVRKAAREAFP
jgi:hypothetical protein